jgi:hypothetical protein
MEEEFISYEQALALKQLGFNEKCLSRYCVVNEWEKPTGEILFQNIDCNLSERFLVKVPLKQQVFRWFREKYDLHHIVIWDSDTNNFDAGLFGELVTPFLEKDTIFSTYEEAENACIDKLIEIAKQQTND